MWPGVSGSPFPAPAKWQSTMMGSVEAVEGHARGQASKASLARDVVTVQQIARVTARGGGVGDKGHGLILGLVAPSSGASRKKTEVFANAPECAE